ncbi:hypothetical protein SPRG_00709 [Saprolegnia parasitica CBS 223.65]|uniref:Thioredoxin-like fold domain-containing protein n=1 Tax=Saprolegnia parasitica (strain CBS 223.65) TaxID=695850 RepID=A0A067D6M2_SAPPC|nr:hypothetical protein SPRG_00709 [Saprolegnia parasitica CBS 223.65]KDO34647.1 hypothetical protein SPRG_00709 [Saprolegnia parasitica CBS 223.65]|eukprot:XP_012194321.1 hypothetical protein SPRG_00709 [Saprolegnia parasitica CBS 223.65]
MSRLLLALATAVGLATAQVPIPASPPGFTYAQGSADAHIQLDMFIDLLCPDSKAAYPALQQVAANLSSSAFRLRFHQFPLPYHHNAYSFAQASRTIAHALGDDTFTRWMEAVYANQDAYWNKATETLGQKQVTAQIGALAKKTFPELTDTQWAEGMTGHGGTQMDVDTRTEWKYACTRGISGTPMYLLNEVPFDADASWTYDDWMKALAPLLSGAETIKNDANVRSVGVPHDAAVDPHHGYEFLAYMGVGTVLGVGVLLAAQRYDAGYQTLR